MGVGTCLDCGAAFDANPRGRPRKRCPDCRSARADMQHLRLDVLMRDGWKCRRCGQAVATRTRTWIPPEHRQAEIHHIVPVAYGGPDEMCNLLTLCRPCHLDEPRPRPAQRPPAKCVQCGAEFDPTPPRARGVRKKCEECRCPAPRAPKPAELAACPDCGAPFDPSPRSVGPLKQRCDPCRDERGREREREAKRRAYAEARNA